ncbi:MAG: DUF4386 domain-containing protein [Terracidiphilus sp.]|jgi:hypothetical protein
MTIGPIEKSQQTAAKVAGLAYLLTFATVLCVHYGILFRLTAENDAEQTARNFLAHEGLIRVAIAGDLLYSAGLFVLLTALYVVLKPVNRGLALLAAFWQLVWVSIWLVMAFNLSSALRLLDGAGYLQAFDATRLHAMAKFYLATNFDAYYIGLLFTGLASTACACLWFKSRYIPRVLAAFGVVTSAFCVACTLALFVDPAFDRIVGLGWFDTPMGLFAIVLSFWLLIRGLRPPAALESMHQPV